MMKHINKPHGYLIIIILILIMIIIIIIIIHTLKDEIKNSKTSSILIHVDE